MKTTIEYATFCEATVYEKNGDSWSYNYTFKTLKEALDWAEFQIEARPISFEIERIFIIDANTGELLATCVPDEESEEEIDNPNYDPDWGYNEDMGFDPYLGCCTDDC